MILGGNSSAGRLVGLSIAISAAALPNEVHAQNTPAKGAMNLPQKVGAFASLESPRRIDSKTIFQYMDGAGEMYLGYRFQYLDVVRYENPAREQILVELYQMASSDDAYGLLSLDWSGQVVQLGLETKEPRALYGAGFLRIWSNDLYARIVADQETEASRAVVMELGRAIVTSRIDPPPPALVGALPRAAAPGVEVRSDRTAYFRSHLALNSVYFLSTANILDLGLSVEAVSAPYGRVGAGRKGALPRLLLVRYETKSAAGRALRKFVTTYLPGGPKDGNRGALEIEDGWTAYALSGRCLATAFEFTETKLAESAVQRVVESLRALEGCRD